MSFWINERAGVAYESNEAGLCKWDPASKSFNLPMNEPEIDSLMFPRKRVSEDEAEAFAKSHAASEAGRPSPS